MEARKAGNPSAETALPFQTIFAVGRYSYGSSYSPVNCILLRFGDECTDHCAPCGLIVGLVVYLTKGNSSMSRGVYHCRRPGCSEVLISASRQRADIPAHSFGPCGFELEAMVS